MLKLLNIVYAAEGNFGNNKSLIVHPPHAHTDSLQLCWFLRGTNRNTSLYLQIMEEILEMETFQ